MSILTNHTICDLINRSHKEIFFKNYKKWKVNTTVVPSLLLFEMKYLNKFFYHYFGDFPFADIYLIYYWFFFFCFIFLNYCWIDNDLLI